jgi:saccharopine dehydrogenase-like NADP-dependent oxidoreductase
MRIAFLGAGAMGSAAARLAARRSDVEPLVLDFDRARAEQVLAEVGRGEARQVDAVGGGLEAALRDAEAVAACLPYRLNLSVMEAALAARCPYADLGGLYHVTLDQLRLDQRFRDAGVPAVLGIGMAPGITNLLARLGADRLDEVDSVELYNGSVERGGGFGVPYSAETILDEFTMPATPRSPRSRQRSPASATCGGAWLFRPTWRRDSGSSPTSACRPSSRCRPRPDPWFQEICWWACSTG